MTHHFSANMRRMLCAVALTVSGASGVAVGAAVDTHADAALYVFNNNSYCGDDLWVCIHNPTGML